MVEGAPFAAVVEVPVQVGGVVGEERPQVVRKEVAEDAKPGLEVEPLRLVPSVKPDPATREVGPPADGEVAAGPVQDHRVERDLDPVAPAEHLARLDVDDPDPAVVLHLQEVRDAVPEPVETGVDPPGVEQAVRGGERRLIEQLPRFGGPEQGRGLHRREPLAARVRETRRGLHSYPVGDPPQDDLLFPALPLFGQEPGGDARPLLPGREAPDLPGPEREGREAQVAWAFEEEVPGDKGRVEVVDDHGRVDT